VTLVSHLAASTKPENLFTVSFMNDWTNEHIAGYEPRSPPPDKHRIDAKSDEITFDFRLRDG
jgi:hypothetical protein